MGGRTNNERIMYDIQKVRDDFPILSRQVYGKKLVYLDNSATTQKPREVVDAIAGEYYSVNANVHRGVHFLSQKATELHEEARRVVAEYIGAPSPSDIVFTRGATEGLNLVAATFGEAFMKEGDEVIVSSPDVPHPVAVRYGWAENPVCNLFNAEGLPAYPFRTDDWPGVTTDKL